MANQWFRMYAEFLHDPKVQMMSEKLQRRLVMLFCARCNGDETFHDDEVTFLLRVSPEEWQHTKEIFIEKGFIDKDNKLLNWDKRQFRSDSSTERVREHREKKKQECNVSVTPPEQNRADTEQSREKKKGAVALKPENISQKIWDDFLRQRKTKFTDTALEGIQREAGKAGLAFEDAIRMAVERGWQSFKADWVKDKGNETNRTNKSKSNQLDDILGEYLAEQGITTTGGESATVNGSEAVLRPVQHIRAGSVSPEEHATDVRRIAGTIPN